MDQQTESGEAGAPPALDGDGAILDALWARVLEAWDDDKPHHALLEYALRAQKLPEVAGRYGNMVLVRCGAEGSGPARTARVKLAAAPVCPPPCCTT